MSSEDSPAFARDEKWADPEKVRAQVEHLNTERCFGCGSRTVAFMHLETGHRFCWECTSSLVSYELDATEEERQEPDSLHSAVTGE